MKVTVKENNLSRVIAIVSLIAIVLFILSLRFALADVNLYKNNDGQFVIVISGEVNKEDVVEMKYSLIRSYANDDHSVLIIINSLGGDAIAGFMIYDMLKNHPHPVYTMIRSNEVAASAAAVIFLGGRYRYMIKGAKFMMHYSYKEDNNGKIVRHGNNPLDKYCDSKMFKVFKDNSALTDKSIKTALNLELVFNVELAVNYKIAKEFK